MNKGKLVIFSALLMSCFLSITAGAKASRKILIAYAKTIFLLTTIN